MKTFTAILTKGGRTHVVIVHGAEYAFKAGERALGVLGPEYMLATTIEGAPSTFSPKLASSREIWMPSVSPVNSEQYAAQGGTHCPVCASGQVVEDEIVALGGKVSQPCACEACGATWHKAYRLAGYIDLVREGV